MNKNIFLIICAILFGFSFSLYGMEDNSSLRRFGIFVGENNGGSSRIYLNYAESDAQHMNDVMLDLGGMIGRDTDLYLDINPETLHDGILSMQEAIQAAKANHRRVELMFYFSGHSDEYGIMLGEEVYSYLDLKSDLTEAGADVTIVILDSCSSGSFTQLRGGSHVSPFLVDESSEMSGHAFLTSSSAAEAAQESQRIEGAFFTHYLISGLRGAADASKDGKVSLNEAYDYAYDETLSTTTGTIAGAQHASYNIQLSGSGDLVLTDIRETEAQLVLGQDLAGQFYIRNSRDQLVAEIQKYQGNELTLAFPPDQYKITIETAEELRIADIDIRTQNEYLLNNSDFYSSGLVAYDSRGGKSEESSLEETNWVEGDSIDERRAKEIVANGSLRSGDSENDQGFFSDLGSEIDDVVEDMIDSSIRAVLKEHNFVYKEESSSPEAILTEKIEPALVEGEKIPGTINSNILSISIGQAGESRLSTGLISTFGYDFKGLDAEALLSIGRFGADGLILAGIGTIYQTACGGAHFSGLFNISNGDFSGFQASGLFNIGGARLSGFQAAGLFNLSTSEMHAGQVSGLFNIANGQSSGFQSAGLFNLSQGSFKGTQLAGLWNSAESLKGFQASIVNVSGDVDGVQLGLVNIADSVNGVSIGLINIIHDGLYHFNGWVENDNMAYTAFQTGSRMLYTTYTLGAGIINGDIFNGFDISRTIMGLSLGTHKDFGIFYTELEGGFRHLYNFNASGWDDIAGVDANHFYASMRAHLGIKLGSRIGIYCGLTLDGLFAQTEGFDGIHEGDPLYELEINGNSHPLYLNPYLGFRF